MYTVYLKPGFNVEQHCIGKMELLAIGCGRFSINEENKSVTLFESSCSNEPVGYFPLDAIKGIVQNNEDAGK